MSEEKEKYEVRSAHWSESEAARQAFAQVVADLGLDGQAIPSILGVERVADFEGTIDEAVNALFDFSARCRRDVRETTRSQRAEHHEANAIAFVDAYLEDGAQIHITARQGAGPDDIVATTLALVDAMATLKKFGIRTTRPRPAPPRSAPAKVAAAGAVKPDGATEFWKAVKPYVGPGRTFENKRGVADWLS